MAKQPAGLVDPRLAKALSHPMRARILTILNERVASPNEIAEMIDERLPNVSYHVRALLELGCIELVSTAQRRGAIEHYYRALTRPFFTAKDWKRLPRSARTAITDVGLQMIWDDTAEAVKSDTFESRSDRHLSRTPLQLDEQGWGEITDLLARALDEAQSIGAKAEKRLAKSKEAGISTRLVLMHFESPAPPEA